MSNKVLIVEDNPLIATTLEMLVEDNLGCATVSAPSIEKARRLIGDGVDVALLDVEVLDGVTFELAADCLRNDIPVIFVSATEPARVPPEVAHVPFIRKPFRDEDVLMTTRRCMRRG